MEKLKRRVERSGRVARSSSSSWSSDANREAPTRVRPAVRATKQTRPPPCRVKYVSSEETCEGYARIAASLAKHTNTGNRLAFDTDIHAKLEGEQLHRICRVRVSRRDAEVDFGDWWLAQT